MTFYVAYQLTFSADGTPAIEGGEVQHDIKPEMYDVALQHLVDFTKKELEKQKAKGQRQ